MAQQQQCSCSIMHLATNAMHRMPSLLGAWSRAPIQLGCTIKVAPKCVRAVSRTAHPKTSITQRTILQCQDGSKGCRGSSRSVDCGPSIGSPHNALGSSVRPGARTVAPAGFFLRSLTLCHSIHTSRNISHPEVTFVTFTQSSIVN